MIEQRYRADVDGLRAVAVGGVLAFHAFPTAVPGGFVGVDVFFVISGYLISSVVLRDVELGEFTFRGFFARRIRRLLPALTTVVLATLALAWFVMLGSDYMRLGRHAAAAEAFAANLAFWREAGYFDVSADLKPLLHLWSLGVEEQFYLTWPLVIVVAARRRLLAPALGLMIIGSFLLNVMTVRTDSASAFYLPHTRGWELLTGAALAYAAGRTRELPPRARNLTGVMGLTLILLAFAIVRADLAFPGWWALLPVGGTFLLLLAGPGTWITTLLSRRMLVGIGLISYPLYLWHWPLLSLARLGTGAELSPAFRTVLLALSVLLAWLTYRFIEQPIRFGAWRRNPRTIRSLVTVSAVIAAGGVAVAAGAVRTSVDRHVSFGTYTYDYRNGYRGGRCQLARGTPPSAFDPACIDAGFGTPDTTSVLLWGDSHAAHLYPGLHEIQRQEQLSLGQYTSDGCKPLALDDSDPCNRINLFVAGRLRELRPDAVVLAADWRPPVPLPLGSVIDAIQRNTGARIIVVGPVPGWLPSLPRVLVSYQENHPGHIVPAFISEGANQGRIEFDGTLRRSLADLGVTYVSPVEALCNGSGCLALSNGSPTAWDDAHLSDEGSKLVAMLLLKAIRSGQARHSE